MKHRPSKYQKEIYDIYDNTNKNLFIEASAGSGKSHTLLELCKRTPKDKKMCFLAFNKSIQEEIYNKLPKNLNIDVRTSHSQGYKILRDNIKLNVKLNENKNFIYCKQVLKNKKFSNYNKQNSYFFQISDIINIVKLNLVKFNKEDITNICTKFNIPFTPEMITDTIKVLREIEKNERNLNTRQTKYINYTDMLYLPLKKVKKKDFPKYDVIFTDECFPYNQYIATGDNSKAKIGSIVRNFHKGKIQFVKSYNEKENKFELKRVTNAWNRGKREVLKLQLGTKRNIVCTPNHKLLTNKGWIEAKDIQIGNFILSSTDNQPYHSFLNEDQKDLFIASTIGDGALNNLSLNINRVRFVHGEKQKDYLYWKANMFNSTDLIRKIDENGYSKKPAYVFTSKGYCIEDKYLEKENVINNLNLKQLAILYMDDGSFSSNCIKLYTLVSDKNLITKLSEKIKELGFDNSIHESKSSSTSRPYWFIAFNTYNSRLLMKEISKYIHPNLSYKVHDEFKNNCGKYKWDNTKYKLGGMVVTNKINNFSTEEVYDIEVEDNHNFILCSSSWHNNGKTLYDGFIAHNCQDFNVAQQKLVLNMLNKNGRLVAVGDSKQSIYGFIGASLDTFNTFKNRPNTVSLELPVTYRCGKKIVEYSNQFFPNSTIAFEKNPEGEIKEGSILDAESGDMVICRNNKPLIQAWIKLTAEGKKSYIIGRDFGNTLKKILQKINNIRDVDKILYAKKLELMDLGIAKPTYHKSYQDLKEKCEILELLYLEIGNLYKVEKTIDNIFRSNSEEEGIRMSTIHKAKGLEADRCFILNWDLLPSEYAETEMELYGEKCLQYVAVTRAKKELIFTEIDV